MNSDFSELLATFNAQAVEYLGIDGVEFVAAWADRMEAKLGGVSVPVLSRHHLIANKKASGRLQDLADVERLEEMEPGRGKT